MKEKIIISFVSILIAALIMLAITTVIESYFEQPNVVYEKLPIYIIAENKTNTTKQQPSTRSVACVLIKNIGHAPAHNVRIEIYSNFDQNLNEMQPKIWQTICHREKGIDRTRATYILNEFADGANFAIYISAPEKEPEIDIDGIHDGGKKIEMEKSTPLIGILIIGLGSYILGLLTFRFLICASAALTPISSSIIRWLTRLCQQLRIAMNPYPCGI